MSPTYQRFLWPARFDWLGLGLSPPKRAGGGGAWALPIQLAVVEKQHLGLRGDPSQPKPSLNPDPPRPSFDEQGTRANHGIPKAQVLTFPTSPLVSLTPRLQTLGRGSPPVQDPHRCFGPVLSPPIEVRHLDGDRGGGDVRPPRGGRQRLPQGDLRRRKWIRLWEGTRSFEESRGFRGLIPSFPQKRSLASSASDLGIMFVWS